MQLGTNCADKFTLDLFSETYFVKHTARKIFSPLDLCLQIAAWIFPVNLKVYHEFSR